VTDRSVFAISWLLLLLSWPTDLYAMTAPPRDEISHVDSSFAVDGKLLNGRFTDIEGDGVHELILAVLGQDGRRELRIHRWRSDGLIDPVPDKVVVLKNDVVSWALADVRPESGRELIFITRSGAYSYAFEHAGYANNIARLIKTSLFFDLVENDQLEEWIYVLPRADGDALLLPGPTGYAIWGPGEDGYTIECDLLEEQMSGLLSKSGAHGAMRVGSRRLTVKADAMGEAPGTFPSQFGRLPWAPFLSAEHEIRSPALVDLNNDGHIDLVTKGGNALRIHLATDQGIPHEPVRTEKYPGLMVHNNVRRDIEFHDLDADGDLDALVRLREARDGFSIGDITIRFLVMKNDGGQLLSETPNQVLTFSGMSVRASVADINGDGLQDLVISKVAAPGLGDLVTIADGLNFTRNTMAFFGEGDARFSRTPNLDPPPISFDEDSVEDAISRRLLSEDFNGDGIADLVDVDLTGQIAIYRVFKESGFFSGESWELDETPWQRFEVRGDIRDLHASDVNGDDLGDVVSFRDNGVTLLLSRRAGDSR
jgi:hypothetical protein